MHPTEMKQAPPAFVPRWRPHWCGIALPACGERESVECGGGDAALAWRGARERPGGSTAPRHSAAGGGALHSTPVPMPGRRGDNKTRAEHYWGNRFQG